MISNQESSNIATNRCFVNKNDKDRKHLIYKLYTTYKSSDSSLIPSRENFFRAMAEKMCDFDFSNYSGEWNATYWNNEKADFTLYLSKRADSFPI